MPDGDWKRVGDAIEARVKALELPWSEVVRYSTVSDASWRKLRAGEPIVARLMSKMSRALGWRSDSFDLIAAGQEPVVLSANAVDLRSRSDLEMRVSKLEVGLQEVRQALQDLLPRESGATP